MKEESIDVRRLIILDAIRDYGATMGKKSIAKMLVKQSPDLFRDVEQTRELVRYHMGSHGNRSKHNIVNVPLPVELSSIIEPYMIPVVNSVILTLCYNRVPWKFVREGDKLTKTCDYFK